MKSEYKIYYLIDSSKREGMKMKLLLYKLWELLYEVEKKRGKHSQIGTSKEKGIAGQGHRGKFAVFHSSIHKSRL
jgi:hypothetical protein